MGMGRGGALPQVLGAAVQVGHHAEVHRQEAVVARAAARLQHREDVDGARAAAHDRKRRRLGAPQPAVGRQRVACSGAVHTKPCQRWLTALANGAITAASLDYVRKQMAHHNETL